MFCSSKIPIRSCALDIDVPKCYAFTHTHTHRCMHNRKLCCYHDIVLHLIASPWKHKSDDWHGVASEVGQEHPSKVKSNKWKCFSGIYGPATETWTRTRSPATEEQIWGREGKKTIDSYAWLATLHLDVRSRCSVKRHCCIATMLSLLIVERWCVFSGATEVKPVVYNMKNKLRKTEPGHIQNQEPGNIWSWVTPG